MNLEIFSFGGDFCAASFAASFKFSFAFLIKGFALVYDFSAAFMASLRSFGFEATILAAINNNRDKAMFPYKLIANLPLDRRVIEMKKDEIKKKILSEDPIKGSTFPLINRIGYTQMLMMPI